VASFYGVYRAIGEDRHPGVRCLAAGPAPILEQAGYGPQVERMPEYLAVVNYRAAAGRTRYRAQAGDGSARHGELIKQYHAYIKSRKYSFRRDLMNMLETRTPRPGYNSNLEVTTPPEISNAA
jgi:hypothetical protein